MIQLVCRATGVPLLNGAQLHSLVSRIALPYTALKIELGGELPEDIAWYGKGEEVHATYMAELTTGPRVNWTITGLEEKP